MLNGLMFCATHGRIILAVSLVVGLISSSLASLIQPYIDVLIALLLFVACLRVGPRQVIGAVREIKASLAFTVALQVVLPLTLALMAWLITFQHPLVFAVVLLTSAPALSGSPHLVALMGFDPAPALRQLVIGTLLLPLTIIPVFALLPQMGDFQIVLTASLRLLAVILIAAAFSFAIRLTVLKQPSVDQIQQIDGVSTILLAIVVVGLMAAIQSEFAINPTNVLLTLLVACVVNFGLQIVVKTALSKTNAATYAVPIGVIAGNRNVALFLTALPAANMQSLLLFIACYQIPMYLTPIVMQRFYQRS